MLGVLADKGVLRFRRDGKRYLYRPDRCGGGRQPNGSVESVFPRSLVDARLMPSPPCWT